jgi:hypothetical protein
MRTINVTERVYGILKYGAVVYNESMGNFLERFIDAFTSKEKAKELITHLKSEINQNTLPIESIHLEMIKEGLLLMREFSLEKAKELEDRLTQIKSEITHLET